MRVGVLSYSALVFYDLLAADYDTLKSRDDKDMEKIRAVAE
jgi:hypothetical protein